MKIFNVTTTLKTFFKNLPPTNYKLYLLMSVVFHHEKFFMCLEKAITHLIKILSFFFK